MSTRWTQYRLLCIDCRPHETYKYVHTWDKRDNNSGNIHILKRRPRA